jgi:DNA invertase Pin-like site-specific DNA recombinase
MTATPVEPTVRPWEVHSGKVGPQHWERLAVVYVRQSTVQQVADHTESTRLQYGLADRAVGLGWPAGRVLVIDDDLGRSGTSATGRPGFGRLVSEVSLDHVGIILGVEMSRLARSGADWHRLLELCALFGTLLADTDGVYDPADYNDRLLLGLKGTMSEAELHLLKQRMLAGKQAKARRGELAVPLPIGYVRAPSGEVMLDPDEQVQTVVRLVFGKFAELGTLNAVLRWLVVHHVQLGVGVRVGDGKGELAWHRPNRMTLQNLLHNPIYAGYYAYGRRQVDPRRQQPGRPATGRVVREAADWLVLLPDRQPAYIPVEQYERNLAQLKANQARAGEIGAVRDGAALPVGLVACGRCGRRMTVRYRRLQRPAYVCATEAANYGGRLCQHLAGPCVDRFVTAQVLAALAPAALELSLAAAAQIERDRASLDRLWQQRLERAGYQAQRARRQYQLAEPEHRLVARQLERAWEDTLAAQQQLRQAYRRFATTQPRTLSADQRAAIGRLAADIPALWDAPTTTDADRKQLIRQVVERVTVTIDGDSEQVTVTIQWAGGARTRGELVRPVARLEQLSYWPKLAARARELAAAGLHAATIAQRLGAEGYRPPKRHERFGPQGVQDLLHRVGARQPQPRPHKQGSLGEHEWWLVDLARALEMPPTTLRTWADRGWVTARQQPQPPRRWVIWADEAELQQLRQRRGRPAGYYTRRRWVQEEPEPTPRRGE